MSINWKGFKSGSDIRGFGIAEINDPLYLSKLAVEQMAMGFAVWLSQKANIPYSELTVSVGHDSRVSSERIKDAVINSLCKMGIAVKDCSLSSTPAMFMTTVDLSCNGAIQITASHHPMDKNGLKFFTRSGGLNGADIAVILENAATMQIPLAETRGSCESVNYMNTYAAMLRDMICKGVNATDYSRPLRGYKIAVDAGNGVGGFYATKVLEPLGADISGSRFLEPDGTFPNHIANPENETAMKFAVEATVQSGADLGIIFDTDVDRAGCVGSDGREINRNSLVAIASCIALEGNDGGTIVTDSVTSDGLAEFITKLGGKHLRFKRGYRNVINKQQELNDSGVNCPLAMETSGHAAFRDNYSLDDGAYLVTKIIIKMAELGKQGKTVGSLIETLQNPIEEDEVRYKILAEDFRSVGEEFIGGWTEFASSLDGWKANSDNYEGIRFSTDSENGDGWILVRMSVHDPVIAINAESNSEGGNKIMLGRLLEYSRDKKDLDISALTDRLS